MYLPFLVSLRRYEIKQISEEKLLSIANIRNRNTIPLYVLCARDWRNVVFHAKLIGLNIKEVLLTTPEYIKCYFSQYLPSDAFSGEEYVDRI